MAKREIVQIKDKETGDINELRDKALMVAEKSSTPSVATNNSVIPLEKEDGEIIKIKAESLMKAFASMINSNSKSTITTLFGALTANNNTEFGAINMSNLASLLGGEIGIQYVSFGSSHTSFENAVNAASIRKLLFGLYDPGSIYLVIGFTVGNYAAFFGVTYNDATVRPVCRKFEGTYTWY